MPSVVAFDRSAPERSAPERSAPERSAPERSACINFTPWRFLSRKSHPINSAYGIRLSQSTCVDSAKTLGTITPIIATITIAIMNTGFI